MKKLFMLVILASLMVACSGGSKAKSGAADSCAVDTTCCVDTLKK